MPRWKHRLDIKSLFEPDAADHDAVAVKIAPEVSKRVQALADSVRPADPSLASELGVIGDYFADVTADEPAPLRMFNDALEDLYDLGDRERIWVG